MLGGCKKETATEEHLLSEDNLTVCPTGAACNFLYADNAGMDGIKILLTTGQYRVFWAHTSIDYSAFSLYMMAPMIGDSFILTKENFLAGKVKYQNNCATCFSTSMLPVDGKIIGRRLRAGNGLPERWLIEADIIFLANGASIPAQPLHLKQYYLPAN
ncbi:hypothetical protein [Pedobacter rhodius]|uniref:Lipoprotein n=1 Tax=Pedobacter rhodius TaxID=3004098 RepID=A0ABT4L2L9_9SPHI|nr:hypothetical protein [Pedobacter sp. SJ11]MCZ4225429.1 hypothetical protein [Pedobacter sp. SJ11]